MMFLFCSISIAMHLVLGGGSVDTRMDPSISGGTLSRGQETLQELKPEKIMMNYAFKRYNCSFTTSADV